MFFYARTPAPQQPAFGLDTNTVVFIAFGVATLVEIFLSYAWESTYFAYGLPLFWRRHKVKTARRWPSAAELENETRALLSVPILFRQIAYHEYAFRERAFNMTLSSVVPVMHGFLKWDPKSGSFTMIGYANWYILFIAGAGIYMIEELQDLPLVAVIALVLLLLYVIQARRFNGVANLVRDIWSRR
jgi:hypothetical protein